MQTAPLQPTAPAAPAPAPAAPPTLTDLEAANVAHFDALNHNFDTQHPFAADFADRLARALRRRGAGGASATASSAAGPSSSSSSSSLVLDEDTTSVLDYACGSGM